MAPKKKTPRNGFYYFMVEFKNRQGKNCRSMQEAAEAAGPHWARMSKAQRQPYEQQALREKNNMKAVKLTSDGLDVQELEEEEKNEQQRLQVMKDEIDYLIKIAIRAGRIHKEKFFIIHVNIFCFCSSENRYYPAEIAIAGFDLDDGVQEEYVFHKTIKPGPLPLGYACEATILSKETHQLPPPLTGDNECNLTEVFEEMKAFLIKCNKGSFPILYTEQKASKMVQQVLDTLCYDHDEDNLFKVYSLECMFKLLRNGAAGDIVWPTDTYSTREIEKDVNAHAKGICCEFHNSTNVSIYCSRSVVVRYAYTICDNCCPDLQIPLVPGKHVPQNSQILSYKSSSVLSLDSRSSRYSSNLKATTREDDSESVVSYSSKSAWDSQSHCTESSFGPVKNSNDEYPALGGTARNSWKSNSRTESVVSSARPSTSYAGVMGPSGLSKKPAVMPSSLCGSFDKMTINDSESERSFINDYPVLGRGRARKPKN